MFLFFISVIFCLFGDIAFSEYFLYHFFFLFVWRVRRSTFFPSDHGLGFWHQLKRIQSIKKKQLADVKNPACGQKVEKTPSGRKERTTYSPYKEKAEMVQKILGKSDISKRPKRKNKKKHAWLSGRLLIEGRLNEGQRLQRKHRDQNEAKQNRRNTREKRHGICKPIARRIQVRFTCDQSTRASEPARARLLWAILFLALPVMFGHTTACRSPALVFSATIHFAMKCPAPYSAVLRHSPSSSAAVVHWSALMPKALRSSKKHPIHSFSWPPTQPAPPTISRNITHFGSLVSSMRAANPSNNVRLLRKVASMISLPVLRSVSR